MLSPLYYLCYMGCCEDCLTCDIAINVIMPLSRASTRGSYSRIEGVIEIKLGEYLGTFELFEQLIDVGKWVFVLDSLLVQWTVVNTKSFV